MKISHMLESNNSEIKYIQLLKLYITPVYKFMTIMSDVMSHFVKSNTTHVAS